MNGALTKFSSDPTNVVRIEVHDNFDSFAALSIYYGANKPGLPEGHVDDLSKPMLNPSFSTRPDHDSESVQIPLDTAENKIDELIEILYSCHMMRLFTTGTMHIMGRLIPFADDGMNSLSAHRRHGGFLQNEVIDKEYRTKFTRLFYGVKEGEVKSGDTFDGALCHNHTSVDYPTPSKEDRTEACNVM